MQNYFIDNFVNPELEATLNSGDASKISEVVKRIERLQELGFEINGKNIFDGIAQKINESIDKLHLDVQPLEIRHENAGEKLKRQIEEMISPIAQGVWNMKQAYSKGKEERKQLEDAFAFARSLSKFQQPDEERKALISGLGNLAPEEREAKYKAAAQEWEGRKVSREAQTINNHARNSGEMEK